MELVCLKDAARMVGCSYDTIRRRERDGHLQSRRHPWDRRCIWVAVDDVKRMAYPVRTVRE